MDVLPSLQQERQLLGDDPDGAADLAARHVVGPDEVWSALGSDQVDLGFSIAEYVNVGRQMVIDVDDDAQTIGTQHGNHATE